MKPTRHHKWIGDVAMGTIILLGFFGGAYLLAQLPPYALNHAVLMGLAAGGLFFIWAQVNPPD